MISKNTKHLFLIIFLVSNSFLYSQDTISKISFNGGLKYSIFTSNSNFSAQILDAFIGYKMKNKFTIGLKTGIFQKLNYTDNSFINYPFSGIAINYRIFENTKNKKIGFEPYASYNLTINSSPTNNNDDFDFLDFGVNIVVPKIPYFYSGTGFIYNLYKDDESIKFLWYVSFGLRF